MRESEIIAYLEQRFLNDIRFQLKKLNDKRVKVIIDEIKDNFLEKIEYLEKTEKKTIDKIILDDLIKEYGTPQNIVREFTAVYENNDVFLWSPLIQIIIGVIFIILEFYSYSQQKKFGDFYLLLLVPTAISFFLLVLGIIAIVFKKIVGNKSLKIIITVVFVIFEGIVFYLLISRNMFNPIQLIISFILFILMIFTFLIIDFLHSISKLT